MGGSALHEASGRNWCCSRGGQAKRARGQKAMCPVTSEIVTNLYENKRTFDESSLFLRLWLNSASRFMGVKVAME